MLLLLLKNWRLVAYAAAAAAVLGWLAYEDHRVFTEGQNSALQKVEQANAKSQRTADRAAKSVDDCYAGGGDWDRSLGVCHHTAGK